ncbi:MAG: HAMP domain-containing sensor histidine kinase [Flavobacteriales bacterium]
MSERPQRRTLLLFSVLSVYVVLQFTWWAVLLLRKDRAVQELAGQVRTLGGHPEGLVDPARSARMVMGEAAVVLLILLVILWLTFRALRRDLGVARTQRNFLLAVTHELRSPIAAIKLQLQTLARPGLSDPQQATLRNIALSEAERLSGLTDKVLLATKADDGLLPLDPVELDAVQIVRGVVERSRTGNGRSHGIHLNAPEQLLITMDEQALRSIAENLVENATKYTPEGTRIEVQVERLRDQWRLAVSDQGPGIPGPEQARIFEKFYRSGNEETRSAKGTGLGLYIVLRLVQRSGGVITVRSGSGQGTTFAATFPLR